MTRILQTKIARGEPMLADDILHLTFFPIGAILMYDGSSWTDNVTLRGWYRCDATNAAAGLTPDLTDKFIMGAAARGNTGGNNNIILTTNNLPAHSHSLSGLATDTISGHTHNYSGTSGSGTNHSHSLSGIRVTGGDHSHTFSGNSLEGYSPYLQFPSEWNGYNKDSGRSGIITVTETAEADCGSDGTPDVALRFKIAFTPSGTINNVGHNHTLSGDTGSESSHMHSYSGTTGSDGSHKHDVSGSVDNTGSGTAFDNRPSYYALIYIRKCA
ncbi:MAG: hypothetical protein LBK68_03680 [Candidatus Margulisbacteria bacterium]|jgi:hypothetical protein|nr:hypothetical protein [Candidatus Margulisiibacteriota bacterium]